MEGMTVNAIAPGGVEERYVHAAGLDVSSWCDG